MEPLQAISSDPGVDRKGEKVGEPDDGFGRIDVQEDLVVREEPEDGLVQGRGQEQLCRK